MMDHFGPMLKIRLNLGTKSNRCFEKNENFTVNYYFLDVKVSNISGETSTLKLMKRISKSYEYNYHIRINKKVFKKL